MQNRTLPYRFKSSHYSCMQIFKLLPYYNHGKTIPYDPHAILDPTILFSIFTLKIHLQILKKYVPYYLHATQYPTILIHISPQYQLAYFEIYTLLYPCQNYTNYPHALLDPTITIQVFTLLTFKILTLLTGYFFTLLSPQPYPIIPIWHNYTLLSPYKTIMAQLYPIIPIQYYARYLDSNRHPFTHLRI